MGKIVLGAVACLCFASTASAQVYVIRPGPPPINWNLARVPDFAGGAMNAYAAGQAAAAARQAQQQQAQADAQYQADLSAARIAKGNADALRSQIGYLISEGKCDDAFSAALKAGDFDTARQVSGLCKPTP